MAWLTLVWVLLWGTFSWADLLGGIVVALVVLVAFPLPAGVLRRRAAPARRCCAWGSTWPATSPSRASRWPGSRCAPGRRRAARSSRSRSRDDSELLMALLVECLSLVPGSVVVEASAAERTLWAHVLGADDEAGIARFRAAGRPAGHRT